MIRYIHVRRERRDGGVKARELGAGRNGREGRRAMGGGKWGAVKVLGFCSRPNLGVGIFPGSLKFEVEVSCNLTVENHCRNLGFFNKETWH